MLLLKHFFFLTKNLGPGPILKNLYITTKVVQKFNPVHLDTQQEVLGSCLDKWMNDGVSTMVMPCTICVNTPPKKKKLAMNLTGVFFISDIKHTSMAITLTC